MKHFLTLLILLLATPCFGQGWQDARMNVGILGGGVAAAGAPSYGVGDLLTERFTAVGTWAETTEGTVTANWNDTTVSGTGFANHLEIIGSSGDYQQYYTKDIGAQSAVYFRFYFYLTTETYGNSIWEFIFNLAPNGQNISDITYMSVRVGQNAGGTLEILTDVADSTSTTSGTNVYTIVTGRIYKVEGKVVDEGATGTAEWRVRDITTNGQGTGTVIGTWANLAALGSVNIQDINIGISYGAASTLNFDTLDISSTGYLTDTP